MGREMEEFESRVTEKMAAFKECLDGMSGLKRELVEDSLRDYCRIAVQLDDVTEKVISTGTTIVNRQGNVVKNPDITTMHQFANEKNALMPKLIKFATSDDEETDDLADFIRG